MVEADLAVIDAEIERMLRRGTRVALVLGDSEVWSARWMKGGDRIGPRADGDRATDLRPPFRLLDRFRPDVLVYFTDGEGPAPVAAPVGVEVLWVITGPHPFAPAPWGRFALLHKGGNPRSLGQTMANMWGRAPL